MFAARLKPWHFAKYQTKAQRESAEDNAASDQRSQLQ
jgi:hypothetical protein